VHVFRRWTAAGIQNDYHRRQKPNTNNQSIHFWKNKEENLQDLQEKQRQDTPVHYD
jgi:hypothetical protein